MRFEDYVALIERTDSIDMLAEIGEEIRRDPDLDESERTTLLSIYLGRKKEAVAEIEEIYHSEVSARLSKLPVSNDLRDVLEMYLTVVAPERYSSFTTLRKNVFPWITEFIEFLAERRKRLLTLDDLDITRLKGAEIQMFLSKKSRSKSTQRAVYSFISVFGKWLEDEGYVQKFPRIKIVIPKAPPEVRAERKIGKPRTLAELDQIFGVISMPMPRVPKERLPMFRYFYHLLLQTGLRPAHALLLTVGDFSEGNVEWVTDVFGRDFVKIPSFKAVEREKRKRGEIITKKIPAPYAFISERLYDEIYTYTIEVMGFDEDDYICPIPMRSLQRRSEFISSTTGIRDFSMYDFRDTWASVIYNCSGYDVTLIVQMGGWTSSQIPVDVYARTMSPSEALTIAKKYEIFLPEVIREKVEAIEAGMKVKITAEDLARRDKLIEELMRKIEVMSKKIEELERR